MIQIQNLKKSFRTEEVETLALNNVNLKVEDGEFAAIMGPSGCGKSTLLNIIGMLDNPTEGSYNFAGNEVGGLKERQRTELRKGNLVFIHRDEERGTLSLRVYQVLRRGLFLNLMSCCLVYLFQ